MQGCLPPMLPRPTTSERSVLVVDDDDAVRHVASLVLQQRGIPVCEACSGEEALRLHEQLGEALGCIVLDLSMPGRGGLETLRALRAAGSRIPALLVSGFFPQRVDLRELGGRTAFLAKPFGASDFAAHVTRLLEA